MGHQNFFFFLQVQWNLQCHKDSSFRKILRIKKIRKKNITMKPYDKFTFLNIIL